MRFDPEFNMIETITKTERVRNYLELNPISVWFMYSVMHDDRFVWGWNTEYEFTIHNPDGKPARKIIKDYDPVKITKELQEKILAETFGERGVLDMLKIVFPKNFTPWYYYMCDDVGRLYVRTFRENEKGEIKWDVFDEEGIYILSFFLPIIETLYCFRNNLAYSFINENEDGIPVVLRYQMDWK